VEVYELLRRLGDAPVELEWAPQRQPVITAIISEKGGVGKTALTTGLAATAAEKGLRVLVIDLDGRATATNELGVEAPDFSVNDLLFIDAADQNPIDPRGLAADAVLPSGEGWPDNVQLIAAERALANRESDNTSGMEHRLRLSLEGVADQYDLVLIDVPPRPGGKLTVAAILAATQAIIPSTLDEDGYIGARDALVSIRRARLNHGMQPLPVVGVLRNIVDRRRTGLGELYDQKLATEWPQDAPDSVRLLDDVAVPRYVIRQEARSAQIPYTSAKSTEAEMIRRAYRLTLNHMSKVA
jgi:chromosome partitioning protein